MAPPGTGLSLPVAQGKDGTGREGALQLPRAARREAGGGKFLLSSPCPHFEGRESCGNSYNEAGGTSSTPAQQGCVGTG